MRSWVAVEVRQGRKVEFTIHLCNVQQIVGEVKPRQRPELVVREVPSVAIQNKTPQVDALVPQVIPKAREKKEPCSRRVDNLRVLYQK